MSYWDNSRDDADLSLLLIHGLFDSKASWRRLCARLHPSFRVVVPDLVGFGDSSKPSFKDHPEEFRYSVSMFAGHLQLLIEKLGLRQLLLVGNSLGGAIVLESLRTAKGGARICAARCSLRRRDTPSDCRETFDSLVGGPASSYRRVHSLSFWSGRA